MSDREKAIAQAKEKKRLKDMSDNEKRILSQAYSTAFASVHGKIVLEDLERRYRYGQSVFTADSERVNIYAQGAQSVIINIKNKIKE